MVGRFAITEHQIDHTILDITQVELAYESNLAHGFDSSVSDVFSQLLGESAWEVVLIVDKVGGVNSKYDERAILLPNTRFQEDVMLHSMLDDLDNVDLVRNIVTITHVKNKNAHVGHFRSKDGGLQLIDTGPYIQGRHTRFRHVSETKNTQTEDASA